MQDTYSNDELYRTSSRSPSIASTSSWISQGDEAAPSTNSRRHSLRFLRREPLRRSPDPSLSSRSCEGLTVQETRKLWQCMLQLQQLYGCYNSTRIDLAVNAGEAGVDLMPNRFIIDTLNQSLVDLPAEGWETLNCCLEPRNKAFESRRLSLRKLLRASSP